MYESDFQRFIDYNIKDVYLVNQIEEKLGIIQMICGLAYSNKVNFEDTFSQVRMWDVIVFNELKKENIVIPPKKENTKSEKYEGAYVKESLVGLHDWVVSFDLTSLYPSLMIQYNISPETMIDDSNYKRKNFVEDMLNKKYKNDQYKDDVCICPNGVYFRKNKQGIIPKLMEKFLSERKKYKKEMLECQKKYEETKEKSWKYKAAFYDLLQKARKINLNSAYGAIGNNIFRYYDTRMAEAVTLSGQFVIRSIAIG
jgi:DNA polymerase elongation subunit (family B)